MDSFLEEPRAIPRPTPIIQEIQAPTVPEVSLMFQNQRKEKTPLPANYGKTAQSYNAWKLRKNTSNTQEYDSFLLTNTNKENVSTDRSLLSKKQVRFESPVSQYPSKQNVSPLTEKNFKPRYSAGNCSPTSNTLNPTEKKLESPTNIQRQTYSDFKATKQAEPTKSFEKLYMSNLPNRELDLSFLEPHKNPCGPINSPLFSSYKPPAPVNTYTTKTNDYNDTYKPYSPKFNRITTDVRTESPRKIIQNKPEPIQTQNYDIISKVNEIKAQNENKPEEIKSNVETVETSAEKNDCDETKTCDDTKKTEESKTNETVTVNDLLSIIKLQNEQLQKLQTQVEKLVKLNEEKITEKPIENQQTKTENQNKNHVIMLKDQQVGTTFNESHETIQQTKENGKQISVGLMTSFEVTYKPPVTIKKHKKQRNLQPVDDNDSQNSVDEHPRQYHSRPNKKHEYSRKNRRDFQQYQQDRQQYEQEQQNRQQMDWNYRQTNETEYSLGSQESLQIQELPESPENSIHIDMQEYDTDSSDDECSTHEGWTFYKDILGQVNNLLENSSRPSYKPRNEAKNYDDVYTDTTLEQIKLATMKRLQNDGFVQPNNDQVQIKPTEVSFAVKQILMKYLPDEGLANVAAKNNLEDKKPTDISVTAFKYMQQCNVVTNAPQYYAPSKGKNILKKSKNDRKILDITTLKQQPKFL